MQYYAVKVMFTRFPIKILLLFVISTATDDFASSVHLFKVFIKEKRGGANRVTEAVASFCHELHL